MSFSRRGTPLSAHKRKRNALLSSDDEQQPQVLVPDNLADEDFEVDDDQVRPAGRLASARKKKRARSSMFLLDDDEQDQPPSPPKPKRKYVRKSTLAMEPSAEEAASAQQEPVPEPEEVLSEEARAAREEEQLQSRWMEEYFEIVEQLPLELHRSYALMRELEGQMQDRLTSITRNITTYKEARLTLEDFMASGASTTDQGLLSQQQRRHLLSQISSATNEAVRAAEEKVGLAVTAYNWVDRHVRRLDVDKAVSEDSLLLGLRPGTQESRVVKEAQGTLNVEGAEEADTTVVAQVEVPEKAPSTPAAPVPEPPAKKARGSRKKQAKEATPNLIEGMAFDPNEPIYCYCDAPSYDDMVACENVDCPREWFHYACVGLTAPPRGKWFCRFCAPKKWKGPGMFVPPKAKFKPPKT